MGITSEVDKLKMVWRNTGLWTLPESSKYVGGCNVSPARPQRGLLKAEESLEAMMKKRRYLPIAAIAAVTLVVAGCSSGGDDDDAMETSGMVMEQPMPTPSEQLTAANAAVAAAEASVMAAITHAERAAAYTELAAAVQMLADAESIPENVLAALRLRVDEAESDLDDAETAALNLRAAIDAVKAAETAADALGADADQAAIGLAKALVATAKTAVDALDAADSARLSSQVASADTMVTAGSGHSGWPDGGRGGDRSGGYESDGHRRGGRPDGH